MRAAGGTSCVVTYRAQTDHWSWIISQAVPLVSAPDVAEAFPVVGAHLLPNPNPFVREAQRTPLALPSLLGEQCAGLRVEAAHRMHPRRGGNRLLLIWRQGSVLVQLSVAGRASRWSVEHLVALALRQDRRIAAALGDLDTWNA